MGTLMFDPKIKINLNAIIRHPFDKKKRNSYRKNKFNNLNTNNDIFSSIQTKREGIFFDKYDYIDVSIVIAMYGNVDMTLDCLSTLKSASSGLNIEVIVIDDNSNDPRLGEIKNINGIIFIENYENIGYLASCNRASKSAKGRYIHLLNNDTLLAPFSIVSLFESFVDDNVGAVGSKLVYPDGTLQEAGCIIWRDGSAWNYGRGSDTEDYRFNFVRRVDYCSAASLMVRSDVWFNLDGFDEHFAPAYCEDSDLAFRMRAQGLHVLYQPASVVLHLEGKSHGADTTSGVKAFQIVNNEKLFARWSHELLTRQPSGYRIPVAARCETKKVILFIDHYVPEPDRDAGSRTVFSIIKILLNENWHIVFIPDNMRKSDYTTSLQALGVEVVYGNSIDQNNWIADNLRWIDAVLLSRPQIASKYINLILSSSKVPVIFYGHDLHHLRMMGDPDPAVANQAEEIMETELSIWKKSDLVLYPSSSEVHVVKNLCPSANALVLQPYEFFPTSRNAAPESKDVVFVAGFSHSPNVDAAVWFVTEIWPQVFSADPRARLKLVGSNPSKEVLALHSDIVEVTGWVSDEELINIYSKARVAVVPLRFGAGIKSKTLEALAYGVPLVTTSIGAQGINNLNRISFIRDDSKSFALAVLDLLATSDQEWLAVSKSGAEYINSYYSNMTMRDSIIEAFKTVKGF